MAIGGRICKKRRVVTTIDNIPKELISEVLARVASSSFTDMFSAKLSCKTFHQVASEPYIFKHVSMDKFPIVAWDPLNDMQQAFLTRCEECDNPNLMFRQAVVDYFSEKHPDSGLIIRRLDKATQLGHIGALYLRCILQIFSGDSELKEKGIKSLVDMKRHKTYKRKLRSYRNELVKMLRIIWVENRALEHHPICCTKRAEHMKQRPWADIDGEDIHCEVCNIDTEISLICGFFSRC